MKFNKKNLIKLTKRPVMDAEHQKKTFWYKLKIGERELQFKKYSQALSGLIAAHRSGHSAKIEAVKL